MISMISHGLSACAGEGDRYSSGEVIESQRVYWSDVAPIFTAECAGCHDDPPKLGAPQTLKTYDEVTPWVERIAVRSLQIKDMPPGGLRGEGAARLLQLWIDQGAPRGEVEPIAGEEMSAGDDELLGPTWDSTVFELFEIYCNTCHANPPTGGAPFPLKTFEQVTPYIDRFYERVIIRKDMPPGGITDDEDLELLRLWLDAGGPQ